jgi:hypothetical protein
LNNIKENGALNRLIELGTKGFLPLFSHSWLVSATKSIDLIPKITNKEQTTIDKIILQLSKHSKIKRKKTLLSTMSKHDQKLFLKFFLKKVEDVVMFRRKIQ